MKARFFIVSEVSRAKYEEVINEKYGAAPILPTGVTTEILPLDPRRLAVATREKELNIDISMERVNAE